MAEARPTARDWWLAIEPLHAVVYFDEGCRADMETVGLRGFWMGYFAGRAAPLGPVGPDVVTATFSNFHPDMVRRSIPAAWERVDPEAVWSARVAGAAAALRRHVPGIGDTAGAARPALASLVAAADGAGRPLFAATRATPEPDDPVAALWWACSCLREHRGDGHVAALTAADLDGVEALVLFAASEGLPPALFRAARGWSDEEWEAATERLTARGLVEGGATTGAGARLRVELEATTDRLAARPLRVLDDRSADRLRTLLAGAAAAVHAAGVIAVPNPMGLPGPDGG